MGCSPSQVHIQKSRSGSNAKIVLIPGDTTLTTHDKRLIKGTWKRLYKNMPEIGAKIFLLIFTNYPYIKLIFKCKDVTGDELLKDSHFRGHASRFMQAVGAAVDNIDELQTALSPLLFTLGQQHIHYQGFKLNYFDAFVEAIMFVFDQELGSKFTTEVAHAWMVVFEFIQKTLKQGYLDGMADPSKVPNPHKRHSAVP